ncbi:hypothetical protein V1477_003416 [Vespula maculifrons]|uniref:Uncharacterized protein n=1 Tax=Vespula maculifrons TaxID=7453 RepID=A0ABD2CX82_VESMC
MLPYNGILVLTGKSGRECFLTLCCQNTEVLKINIWFLNELVHICVYTVWLAYPDYTFINTNCLIWYEIISKFRVYVYQIIASFLNTSSNRAIASRRFLQMKRPKDLKKSVSTEYFGKGRDSTI